MAKTLELLVKNIFCAKDVFEAEKILLDNKIDLIISDINLPKISGIEFIKKLREKDFTIPVIFISAYTNKEYLLEATKLKLVDYLEKPINFEDLLNALLNATKEIVLNGNYIVDFENETSYNIMQKTLYFKENKKEIDLTAKEIQVLEYFIENHKRVITHEELKNELWSDFLEGSDSALKNVLNKLRKKIGKETIKNISGIGFKINLN